MRIRSSRRAIDVTSHCDAARRGDRQFAAKFAWRVRRTGASEWRGGGSP
jgi:hypothetical protein